MKRSILFAALLALSAATSTGAATMNDNPESASADVLADFMHAWSASDAGSLARLFSDDADLVTPDGTMSRGRSEIMAFYAAAFSRGYRGSTGLGEIKYVREIAPGLVLVDAKWSIEGARKLDGSARNPEHGILVSLMAFRNGTWRIVAMRESASASAFTPLAVVERQ